MKIGKNLGGFGAGLIARLLACGAAALWTLACGACGMGPDLQRFESKRVCMGVQTRVMVYARDRERAEAAQQLAYAEIGRLEKIMSDYRVDSELKRLEASGARVWTAVSADLYEILALSERLSAQSGGAFDVTVGPASALWREARRTARLAPEEERAAALARVGWRGLELDGAGRARLAGEGMRLDLGGIAKGYAAQRAVDRLRRAGAARCLVALAGDIVVGEAPPGAEGWEVALAGLAEDDVAAGGAEARAAGGSGPAILRLRNAAVSTSGDREQFVEIDGRRYSHILDPRTGLGTPGGLTVTVVADLGEIADALPTAICVMGLGGAQDLVRRYPRAAAIIRERGDGGGRTVVIDPARRLRWAGPAPRFDLPHTPTP